MQRYRVGDIIGDGTFGVVRAAISPSNEPVAVKTLKTEADSWEACRELREVASLCTLSHPNIIKLKEVIREVQTVHLVFELAETNMCKMISERNGIPFRNDEVRLVMYQLFAALQYLHERGMMHRDVKPENLLCNGLEMVKLGDFGLARSVVATEFTDYVSTRWYRAPEVLLHAKSYSPAVDLWAAGAVMAELFLLRPLFPGTSEADQLFKICSVLGTPPPDGWPAPRRGSITAVKLPQMQPTSLATIVPASNPDGIDLLSKLLTFDATARITARSALQHPFFNV